MELLAPDTLINGRYRIIRKIGQGGMGAVYEATDERLRSRVALKQTLVEGETFSRAFEREAQLLANLRHPSLPRVIDHFVDERGQFLVMDYIEGADLASLLKDRGAPFTPGEALRWADLLLNGLEYLHSHDPQIIHRDIKPQNIKLTPQGQLVLLDFGLAKGNTANGQPTRASLFGYTPQFAPLEQVQGTGTDSRSDIYSVGATLYNLLSGQSPADVISRAAALLNRQADPLRPLHELNAAVTPMLSAVVSQAMAMAADERFASAAAMRRALNAASAGAPRPTILIEDDSTRSFADQPAMLTTRPASRPPSRPASRPPSQPPTAQPALEQPGDPPGFAPPTTDDYPQRKQRRSFGFAGGCLVSLVLVLIAAIAIVAIVVNGFFELASSVDDSTVQTSITVFSTIGPTIDAAINPPREQTAQAAAMVTSAAAAPAVDGSLPAAQNLTNNSGRSDHPITLVDGAGNLHLIWRDNSLRSDNPGEDVLYLQRTSAGQWSTEPFNLSDDFDLLYGDLALLQESNLAICAFWSGAQDSSDPTTIGLYKRCLADNDWQDIEPIQTGIELIGLGTYRPVLNAYDEVEFLVLKDAGTLLFNGTTEIGDPANLAFAPQLTIDGTGAFHVLWVNQSQPFQLVYASSSDGKSWNEREILNDEQSVPAGSAQQILADNAGNLHVTWSANGEVYYRRATPGNGWDAIVNVSQGAGRVGTTSLGLAVGADGRAHLAWQGDGVTYAEQSADGSWNAPRRISDGSFSGNGPTIAVDPQGLRHIVWQNSENNDLFYATIEE